MDEKLARLSKLKEDKRKVSKEIAKLAVEISTEVDAVIKGDRKPRKPRATKQLQLVK